MMKGVAKEVHHDKKRWRGGLQNSIGSWSRGSGGSSLWRTSHVGYGGDRFGRGYCSCDGKYGVLPGVDPLRGEHLPVKEALLKDGVRRDTL